ncbi:hypothetical protein [Streptomyces violaceusniger]|uniref:hypothetical protein n=1 Tax=Streptomyces violaceusniger TaxID=68280 RepID=UPI00380391F6
MAVPTRWRGTVRRDTYERRLVTALEAGPVLPALREVLATPTRVQEYASDLSVPLGYLLGNATTELVPHDAESSEIVARSHARFTQIVADALRRAQADGEVTRDAAPEAQAQLLLFTVQGLSLVSRAGLDTATAFAAIDALIDALRA